VLMIRRGERCEALHSKRQIELLVPAGTIVFMDDDVLGWREKQIAVMLNRRP
jgi:hypothetical protein